ncbi:MAG TPA: ATP synthase F1 subunit delta [Candidatus Moranbacteria bacterium]|nr:ATP synthase F1 subunit delta [Candidatus Moranbacteria bacterium]HRZ33432.1 ATP synthase F1 subunit delta [Candidatus Moranbacteria bacterium]
MKATIQQYAKTLSEITADKTEKEISGIVAHFAEILKKEGQFKNIQKIIEKFSEFYNSEHGIVEVSVTTKFGILGKELKDIEDFIKNKCKAKKVIIKNTIDEKIKGGIIIKIGDEILDGSVSSKLKKIKKVLSN